MAKDDSKSSFDWDFSAPPSPTAPQVFIKIDAVQEDGEFLSDEEDEGLKFNLDHTSHAYMDTKRAADIQVDTSKEEEFKQKLNKTKESLQNRPKIQR